MGGAALRVTGGEEHPTRPRRWRPSVLTKPKGPPSRATTARGLRPAPLSPAPLSGVRARAGAGRGCELQDLGGWGFSTAASQTLAGCSQGLSPCSSRRKQESRRPPLVEELPRVPGPLSPGLFPRARGLASANTESLQALPRPARWSAPPPPEVQKDQRQRHLLFCMLALAGGRGIPRGSNMGLC